MATNDFLPFATAGGANVVTQAAYAALPALSTGYQAGVAASNQLNKTWRQSSIMAAVLAQFAADYSGQNSTDDGTTATLETNLIAAIRGVTKTGVLLTDTGVANAYTASNVPALTSGQLVNGIVQQVVIAHANTGASTYAPDGLTAYPIYGLGLQALQGGELYAGGTAVLMRATIAGVNSGNPIWVLMECAGGAQQIAPATQSQHAVQLGQLAAGNVNLGSRGQFTSSSTFTVPANVTTIWYSGCAGGGGGGGSGAVAGASSYSATSGGGGGAPGQWVRRVPLTVTPGQVLTITLGAGGTHGSGGASGGAGATGAVGGNTTITGTGVSVTLTGGAGGHGSGGISGSGSVGNVGLAGGSGADDGFYGIAVASYGFDSGGWGGRGGNTPFGESGGSSASGIAIRAGIGYGAGGSGGPGVVSNTSAAGANGADGLPGYVELEW